MKINFRVFTVSASDTILKTMKAINEGGIGLALVEDENRKYLGLITDGDIRRALLGGADLHDSIRQITGKDSVTASAGTPYATILSMMTEKIRHIPILDQEGRIQDVAYFSYRQEIPIARPSLKGNELKYVTECIIGNWISSNGKYVREFERRFSDFCAAQYGLAVSNGTVALHLALASLGIGRDDEVIVPSLTFIATANAVAYTGARPVFVDSEADTWNIDPEKIEEVITPNTKAIIPVHLYGQPAKMDEIMTIARKYDLYVIEDAAEAHGAEYKGKKVGPIGDIGCYSFFGNKIITTGEGGMLITNDRKIYDKAKILRDHGMSLNKKYWHDFIGFNYRMTNIQAAIGCAQMEKIDSILEEKQKIAQIYKKYLSGAEQLILPPDNDWSKNVYWMYPVLINKYDESEKNMRDTVLMTLQQENIESRPVFFPIHHMPPYASEITLPTAERISNNGIVLPSYVGIQEDEIQRICKIIRTI